MAVTEKTHTGDSSKTIFDFTFPYVNTADVKASLNGTATTNFIFHNATNLQFTAPSGGANTTQEAGGAPKTGVTVKIYRQTGQEDLVSEFFAGSAIKASDLNNNLWQNLYVTQEYVNSQTTANTNAETAKADAATAKADAAAAKTATDTYVHNGSALQGDGVGGNPQGLAYAVTTATDAKTSGDNAKLATDRLVATTSNNGSTWTLAGNNTNASTDPKGVGYAVTQAEAAVNGVTGKLDKSGGTMTGVITFDSAQTFDPAKLSTTVPANKLGADIDTTKMTAATVVTEAEQANATVNDTSFFTTEAGDKRYWRQTTHESILDNQTWISTDGYVASTAAIDDRVIELVTEVGGFVPLASEADFPNSNPDVNDSTGTIVSIGELGATYTPNSGTCTIPDSTLTNISGSDVTITDCGTTVLTTGFGCLVETTGTLHTYKFHRLTPKATEVTTVAGNNSNITTVAGNNANITTVAGNTTNINAVATNATNINAVATNATNINTVATNVADVENFADKYQINTSAPTTREDGNGLATGDLWFDSSSNKAMMVYDGSAGDGYAAVTPSQSVLNDIAIVSGNITYEEDLGSIGDALATGSGSSITTVADNINNVNSFHQQYKVLSTTPGSPSQGDLWYDSTNTIMKYYNGTTWLTISGSGIMSLLEDTTPELGGNLDCNDKHLENAGTVSGTNLQIDFGTL